MNKILILGFHVVNLILIILYLYPGSLLGFFLYNDISIQPQITGNFLISSNHFYAFMILSTIGIAAYNKTKKINILVTYLILLSILLEFFHFIIPNRDFELRDLFGNIAGSIFVIIIYKVKNKYVKN